MADEGTPSKILFLCTANRCRSPLAAALLRRALARRVDVEVDSAGVLDAGFRCPPLLEEAARSHGLDLGNHRARTVTSALVQQSDLVVGMAREHVRHAAVLVPESFSRSFTMRELVRRGMMVGNRRSELAAWVASVHAGRSPTNLLGVSSADDIVDPYNGTAADYARLVSQLDVLVATMAELIWPGAALRDSKPRGFPSN